MARSLPAVFLIVACGSPAYLPDGGRPRQVCDNTPTAIVVTVRDIMGQPLGDAEVTVKNPANGKTEILTTGGDGRTYFTDAVGAGYIEVTATSGALKSSQPYVVQVVCGECDCTAMPGSASLTLQ